MVKNARNCNTTAAGGLTARQARALAALLIEKTNDAAAKAAGVSPRTLRDWLREPSFMREYRKALSQIVMNAIGRLQRACDRAVDALARNLECGSPGSEIAAAKAILDQSLKAVEMFDILNRLELLESRVAVRPQGLGA